MGKAFFGTKIPFYGKATAVLVLMGAITTNFSTSVFASTHSLSMSTSGTVSVDVSTTGNGTAVGQDNLTIISTCPNGYTVTIKGPNNTSLYKDGNTANNATNTKITPSAGTISNPLPITDNTSNGGANYRGTWGYSLTSSVSTGNFIGLTSATTTLFTKNTASGDGNIVGNGTSTGTTDTIPIYYGVSTTLDQAPGLYTMSSTNNSNGAITYFITTPQSCTSYTVAYNPTSTANSTTLTGTGTMPNQTISEDTATNLNTNAFAAPTGYSFNGWNTKQDGTGTHYANNASVTNLIPAGQTITLYAEWSPNSYTCTKRYRLQNADGTFPDTYTADTTEQVPYNTTCTYTKSVTDYKGVYNGTNNAQASTSHLMDSTNGITLSLDLYRNTYTLVVHGGGTIATASATTTAVHDSNYYRWGQEVNLSATKAANTTCKSYGTITWSQLWNTTVIQMGHAQGTFTPSTTGNNVAFIMGKGNALVEATSAVSNVAQTITLSRSGGASGINIGGTNYTGSSVSLNCGTYNISGNYSSGYEFSSWSRSGSVTVANTSSASTTMSVTGPGTLTLAGKQSCVSTITGTTMQSFSVGSTNYCVGATGTLTDSRDNNRYNVAKLADGKIWLLDNLELDLTDSTVKNNLSASNTNASATTLNYLKNGGGTTSDKYATAGVATWGSSNSYSVPLIATSGTCANNNQCANDPTDGQWVYDALVVGAPGSNGWNEVGIYYNYCAASAGSYCYGNGINAGTSSGNATEDICPKGWRMPTGDSSGEYQALYAAYSSNATDFSRALSTPLSGYFNSGLAYSQGSGGFFWSSTRYNGSYMYYMNLNLSNVYPQVYDGRQFGNSVRCILGS